MEYWMRNLYLKSNMAQVHQDNIYVYSALSYKNLKSIFNIFIYGGIITSLVLIMEILFYASYKYANF